ncbi:hypothetical protein KSB_01380 [Ktedonobacter robiniae]|uniref:Uncharacterized protein n=1 Tax=Ktedonobacter robiniae TaxID=2778365 RepID=A0ABQ3UG40_9CHLR|nr:hypothetical protein KSB_01380 [Ktedonobacter robiniae]
MREDSAENDGDMDHVNCVGAVWIRETHAAESPLGVSSCFAIENIFYAIQYTRNGDQKQPHWHNILC